MKILNRLDLFGKQYILEENDSTIFTTLVTRALTVLIIISCIIIGFLFGKEIYQRKNPTVISGEEMISYSRVNTNDYPIIFLTQTGQAVNLPNIQKHVNMVLTFMTIDENLDITSEVIQGFQKCDITSFNPKYFDLLTKFAKSADNNSIDMYCINDDRLFFQNDLATRNSTYINVRFSECNKKTQECGDEEERDKYFSDMYINMVTYDSYFDPSIYDDPVVLYEQINSQQVGRGLLKRNYVKIENRILISNEGWIFDDPKNKEYSTMSDISKEVNTSTNGNFYWVTLSSPNKRIKNMRSYMKIQDLLAKIGGFFNALFIIIYVLSNHYISYCFYNSIFNHFMNRDRDLNVRKMSSNYYTGNFNKDNTDLKIVLRKIATIREARSSFHNSNLFESSNLINNKDNSESNEIKDKFELKKNTISKFFVDTNKSNVIDPVILKNKEDKESDLKNASNTSNAKHDNKIKSISNLYNSDQKIIESNNPLTPIIKFNNKSSSNNNKVSFDVSNSGINKIVNNYSNLNNNPNSSNNIIDNNVPLSNKDILNNINNKIFPIDYVKPNNYGNSNLNIDDNKDYLYKLSYLKYIWNDLVCFRKKMSHQLETVKKILSFNTLLELNYNYYTENKLNFEYEDIRNTSNLYNKNKLI